LEQIQKEVLDDDTILLEYSLGKETSYLWAVTNKSINSYKLPGKEELETLSNQVLSYYRTFFHPENESELDKKRNIAKEELFVKGASNFSQMILGPVANQLGKKRLLVVADGILQYIPFAGLPDPNATVTANKGLRPLVVDHEVITIPSASTMALLRGQFVGRKSAPKPIAVFADPIFNATDERLAINASKKQQNLTTTVSNKTEQTSEISLARKAFDRADLTRLFFSGEEAKNIGQIYNDAIVEIGLNASLSKVTSSELSVYRILHFATHGFFNSLQPELSGLVLSLFDYKGQEQSGYLTTNHIYNLRLNADLVVLSACQTGLGKEIRGEGILGLTRGFMYAGAERVMFSLWNVNDKSTSILMTKFYTSMKEGLTPAAALRQAQIAMWKDKQWSTPYYWAAFQIQGEWQKKQ
jgi:CHAT domain-containing protein